MEFTRIRMWAIPLLLTTIATLIGNSEGVAVMSIDIGSEYMKVAIVSPGIPMEIALNKESKRKTPAVIAFRNGERTFGEDAQGIGVRFPQYSFSYILDLLGKSIHNPMVQLYMKRFPYYDIIEDEERHTVLFRLDANTTFAPEELLAQLLHKGKEFAEASAGQRINEAVITVPGFFNQVERRALMQAAELAEIKVLQLINDYTAVALNYGIFSRKEINDTIPYILFYDMGASSTTATIVSYQNVKTKEKGYVETNPHINILGVGYDRTLGGLEMQLRLQNYLAKEFDALNKTSNSVFDSPRAMAKLFKEAGRVKHVLSANPDHYAQIEGLIDEHEFRLQVTRSKLEDLCADVFERVSDPIEIALKTAGITKDIISQVVIVGAGTRVPKVQEKLISYMNMELSKNVNADEAAVLGAVYKAADLSQGFKVKKYVTKDAVLFPIQILFDRSTENKGKQVKKTLFGKMNPYPQKKIITFNKHSSDFTFHINYAELDYLPNHEITALGNLHLSTISLTGVSEALDKHIKDGGESKGIKAYFVMDDSGILEFTNAVLVSEKSSTTTEEDEGTLSMLGSTISKFFTGLEDKNVGDKVEDAPVKEDVKPVHENVEAQDVQKDGDDKSKKKNDTSSEDNKPANKTEKTNKDKKSTVVTIKDVIPSSEHILGPARLFGEKLTASRKKLEQLETYDLEKSRRETALNNLETFVIDAQLKLETEEYSRALTPQEAENILKACSEVSEWLYEDGFGASAVVYEEKLIELQKLTNDVYERVFEHKERPEVLKGMVSMLNGSTIFLNNMRNLSLSKDIFTPVEIETLEKVINETQDYYDMVIKSFKETALHDNVKYKVRDIANKMAILDREVKYLVNKAKIWRPKQEASSSNTENKTESAADANQESQSDSTSKSETQADESVKEETVTDNSNTENGSSTSKLADDSDDLSVASKDDDDVHLNQENAEEETHQEL
uniref:Hypoxia up-regulated protein 1 n=1 Tax=Ampulex compressa TaxID=860918 RepID=A0A1W6EWB4_AMPCP|nr:hypoxia up-regulated protein 1 [Ampulex compressa]